MGNLKTEPDRGIVEPTFKMKHSVAIRIWHWSNFILIMGSLITVLFAKTLLNTKDNIPKIQDTALKSNLTITPEQAKSIAHNYTDLAWNWHTIIGYILATLVGFRILFEFFQPKNKNLLRY
jgi:Ni/Fe-hydrogenase 1 B-type cytochrome subunit